MTSSISGFPQKLKCFFLGMKKVILTNSQSVRVTDFQSLLTFSKLINYIQVLGFYKSKTTKTTMSVSRTTSSTVSNQWFTPTKSSYKGRRYRSAEQQARHDAAKTEHAAASHAAAQGDWVVKGKRHNKMAAKEQTPEEKAEAARIQTMQDLKEIEKTISGSMSVINRKKRAAANKGGNPKKRKIAVEEKKPKKIKGINAFSLLVVDSTDDEAEAELEVKTIEVKPQEFPVLSAPSRKVETPSKISYSFALQTKPTKKQIGPEDFPDPPKTRIVPKTRVCWADHLDDFSDEEDGLPMRPGQSWGDFA